MKYKQSSILALVASLLSFSITSAMDSPTAISVAKYDENKVHAAFGLDSTFLMGAMTTNGFGFPKMSIGMSTGLDIRKFTNLPSQWSVQDAENKVRQYHGLEGDALIEKVVELVNPGHFNYIQFGTENVTNPKIGVGTLVSLSKSQKAFLDIGVSYPRWLNLGVVMIF